jgi:short-subunit dehydrogenase
MKEFTLITGASSGIGYEMAKILASKKHNLILVARSQDKLEELSNELKHKFEIEVFYFLFDLSKPNSAEDLHNKVKESNLLVTGLINNAGFGDYGDFGADMVQLGKGKIMNVASILSFIPFPYYSVYSATKSFVLAFTETVSSEFEGTGVTLTALCPGAVETEFHTNSMRKTNAMKINKPMPVQVVAKAGVELFLNGKSKKVVGFLNWFISNLPRVTPDVLMIKIKKNLASIK